jgi:hypothetical protein
MDLDFTGKAALITGAQYVVDGGRTATGGAVTQAMQS